MAACVSQRCGHHWGVKRLQASVPAKGHGGVDAAAK
jgi:hypothetical protein